MADGGAATGFAFGFAAFADFGRAPEPSAEVFISDFGPFSARVCAGTLDVGGEAVAAPATFTRDATGELDFLRMSALYDAGCTLFRGKLRGKRKIAQGK
jgi:hypothetical protein